MNKDDLIALKQELTKNERYALLDQDMELSLISKTKFEIVNEIDNIGAIKTFEELLEQYLKMCVANNTLFDEFKVKIYPEYYVGIDKIKNEKGFIDDNKINKEAILDDILKVRFAIYPYLNDEVVIPKFSHEILRNNIGSYNSFIEYCYNKSFIINYSEFINGIKNLDYDIDDDAKSFSDISSIDGIYNGEIEFTSINFKEKARKK